MRIALDLDWYPVYGKRVSDPMTPDEYEKSREFFQQNVDSNYPGNHKGSDWTQEEADRRAEELWERSGLRKTGVLISDPEYPTQDELLPAVAGKLGDADEVAYREILESYYFQLRNSVAFILDEREDHIQRAFRPQVQEHRDKVLMEAIKLANFQVRSGKIVVPHWMEDVFWELDENLVSEAKELWRAATLRLFQGRSFYVYVRVEENTLFISLLLKAHLQSLLLAMLNVPDARAMFGDKVVRHQKCNFILNILTHLWIFRADFSLMNIPHVHPLSDDSFTKAKRWSHFASLFLILHELAHFAHRHKVQGLEAEFEADAFALEALLEMKAPDPDNLITAIDHLFQVMCLIQTVQRFGMDVPRRVPKELSYFQRLQRLRAHPTYAARVNARAAGAITIFERTCQWFLEMLPQCPRESFARILGEQGN